MIPEQNEGKLFLILDLSSAHLNDKIILIDEILTPDSSRFWDKESYQPGKPQLSFDKQFVGDYLESLNWDKKPPAPQLPEEIVQKTREKYQKAYSKPVERVG